MLNDHEDLTPDFETAGQFWEIQERLLRAVGKGHLLDKLKEEPYGVLDLGCRSGVLVELLRRQYGVQAFGVDLADELPLEDYFLKTRVEEMPFKDETFVFAHARGLFDTRLYANNPEAIFRSTHRVLQPGAVFMIHDANIPNLSSAVGFNILELPFGGNHFAFLEKQL